MNSAFSQRGGKLALTAIASGILVACGGGGGSSAGGVLPPVVVAPAQKDAIDTAINILVVDENAESITSDVVIEVKSTDGSSTGDAARLAPYGTDNASTVYTVNGPSTNLGLISTANNLAADALDVIFVAFSDNHVSSSQKVSITEAGTYIVTITMVSKTPDPKIPVAAASPAIPPADADSKTSAEIKVVTPSRPADAGSNQAEVKGSGGITVPSGTKILVDDGTGTPKPAASGPLQINVAYFENDEEAGDSDFVPADGALTVFPGGLDVAVESNSGASTEGAFSSAGFISVDLTDSDGNVVTNFVDDSDQPKEVTIDITIPVGTANPDPALDLNGNGLVDEGEKVPVWSYNELTGTWQAEKDPTDPTGTTDLLADVTDDDNDVALDGTPGPDGLLNVSFTTTHLSYFNLDYYGNRCSDALSNGTVSANVLDSNGQPNNIDYDFAAYQVGGGWSRYKRSYIDNTAELAIARAPSFPVRVKFLNAADSSQNLVASYTKNGTTTPANANGELELSNLCELDGADINFNIANPANLVSLNFETVEACEQDETKTTLLPTTSYLIRSGGNSSGSRYLFVDTEDDGRGTLGGLDPAASYRYFGWSRSENGYKLVRDTFTPADLNTDTLTVVVDTIECEVEDPTGATGGTGGTGAGGTGN